MEAASEVSLHARSQVVSPVGTMRTTNKNCILIMVRKAYLNAEGKKVDSRQASVVISHISAWSYEVAR